MRNEPSEIWIVDGRLNAGAMGKLGGKKRGVGMEATWKEQELCDLDLGSTLRPNWVLDVTAQGKEPKKYTRNAEKAAGRCR